MGLVDPRSQASTISIVSKFAVWKFEQKYEKKKERKKSLQYFPDQWASAIITGKNKLKGPCLPCTSK